MSGGVNGVNKCLKAGGYPEVELVKGEGYFYFVFDNIVDNKHDLVDNQPQVYETENVMVCNFRDQMFDHWVRDGIDFAERIKREHEHEHEPAGA